MGLVIYEKDFNEMLLEKNYPDWVKDASGNILERSISDSFVFGDLAFNELYFQDIHISYGNFRFIKDTQFYFNNEFESVQMHFMLNGNSCTSSKSFQNNILFKSGSHNLFYLNGIKSSSNCSSQLPMYFFEINMSPKFFERYLSEQNVYFKHFRNVILQKQTSVFNSAHNYPISEKMKDIIAEIITCKRKGVLKHLFLESKVISLLLLQLEQLFYLDTKPCYFTKMDKNTIEKIYFAKELCERSLESMDTLKDLAKKVGTNEFTLKKGFKEIFGVSVYSYWKKLRLKTAKEILIENTLSIKEVSNLIGYKYVHHFADAFKKEFGFLPSQIHKKW